MVCERRRPRIAACQESKQGCSMSTSSSLSADSVNIGAPPFAHFLPRIQRCINRYQRDTLATYEPIELTSVVPEAFVSAALSLKPSLVVGAAGSLSILQSLGFHVQHSRVINPSYDSVLDGGARATAAIDELERLLLLPRTAFRADIDALMHNWRHVACGGLGTSMAAHAAEAVAVAARVALTVADERDKRGSLEDSGGKVVMTDVSGGASNKESGRGMGDAGSSGGEVTVGGVSMGDSEISGDGGGEAILDLRTLFDALDMPAPHMELREAARFHRSAAAPPPREPSVRYAWPVGAQGAQAEDCLWQLKLPKGRHLVIRDGNPFGEQKN
eukprot:1293932-Pleurochrysis_carterae.AAC.2